MKRKTLANHRSFFGCFCWLKIRIASGLGTCMVLTVCLMLNLKLLKHGSGDENSLFGCLMWELEF